MEKKLYNMLLPDIKKVYKKYDYLNLEDDYILSLSQGLLKNANYDNFNKFKQQFLTNFENLLNNIVFRRLQDYDSFREIIKSFSSKMLSNPTSYKSVITEINKILDFFKKYNLILSPDFALAMLGDNPILNSILKVIVNSNIKMIEEGDIDKLFDDMNILVLIEIYCSNNNIKIKQDSYLDKSLYDFNDDFVSDDITRDFIIKLRKIPLPSPEENKELLLKAKTGDINARDKFIYCNLRLVFSIAKKYCGRGIPFIDLIQEGSIGFMRAIELYDFNKNCQFSTYATCWISQAIIRAIDMNSRNIRIPVQLNQEVKAFKRIKLRMEKELGYEPSIEAIAAEANISNEKAILLDRLQCDTISLNQKINDEDDSELELFIPREQISVESQVIRNAATDELKKLMKFSKLTKREIEVLACRKGLFGCEEKTLEEIGISMNITRERVRQIEAKAIRKLTETAKSISKPTSEGIYVFFYQHKKPAIDWAINHLLPEEKEDILLVLNGRLSKQKVASRKRIDYASFCKKFDEIIVKVEKLIKKWSPENMKEGNTMQESASKTQSFVYECTEDSNSGNMDGKTLYECLKDYRKDEIDNAIKQLTAFDRSLLRQAFGDNLSQNYSNEKLSELQANRIFTYIIPKIARIIDLSQGKVSKNYDLYIYLGDYNIDDLAAAVKTLSADEQELFYLRFGENFDRRRAKRKLTLKEKNKIFYVILPKIKQTLEGKKQENCADNELLSSTKSVQNKSVNASDRNLLGGSKIESPKNSNDNMPNNNPDDDNVANSDLPVANDSEKPSDVKINIDDAVNQVENSSDAQANQSLQKHDIFKILELLKTASFEDMLKVLSVKESVIISLRLGYIDGKYFTCESIANFLGISTLEVIETTKKIMDLYRENIIAIIDGASTYLVDDGDQTGKSDGGKQKKIEFKNV